NFLTFLLVILANSVSAQSNVLFLKFVGYDQQSPVFMYVTKTDAGVSPDLVKISEADNQVDQLMDMSDYKGVFAYQDGKMVAVNQAKKLVVINQGKNMELVVEADQQAQKNFVSGMNMAMSFQGVSNLSFSQDGQYIYIPPKDKVLRKYAVETGELTPTEASGLGLFYPVEAGDYLFYLTVKPTGNGYEFHKLNLKTQEKTKTPFEVPGGMFRLLIAPDGKTILLIQNGKPYAYHVETERFQEIEVPAIPVARRKELMSDFDKVYFSTSKKEWRYATMENGKPVTKSLDISLEKEAFELSLEALNNVSVSLDEVTTGMGRVAVSGAQSRDFEKALGQYVEVGSGVINDNLNLQSATYTIGDAEGDYSTSAVITVCWPEGNSVPEGTYPLKSMDTFYENPTPERFVDVAVLIQGNYYKIQQGTEGTVEVKNIDGKYHIDLTFKAKGLGSMNGVQAEQLQAAGAFKFRGE
ncbi:MAG: hypothetical protein AAGI38_03250, partial [Bacteroidota bacterium]